MLHLCSTFQGSFCALLHLPWLAALFLSCVHSAGAAESEPGMHRRACQCNDEQRNKQHQRLTIPNILMHSLAT